MGSRILTWSVAAGFFGCLLLGLNPEWHPSWLTSVIGYLPFALAGVNFILFFVSMFPHDKAAKQLSGQERRRAMQEHWGVAHYVFLPMSLASVAGLALFQSSIDTVLDSLPQNTEVGSVIYGLQYLFIAMMSAAMFLWITGSKRAFAAAKEQS